MAVQWERLKTGLGIGPEPVAEPESLPSQLLHQLDEATTLSKTQAIPVADCMHPDTVFCARSNIGDLH